ncbi:Glu-tRNA(Gln) amidotransferase subunit GatE [Methanohalobium sp.]|uniref:Glu-tRNA(Gln) amidotransferase subunit GatE n=1 Tax=Methanohalobium sp. TaxID=2837493 RepID=UPI0025CF7D3A|nr:Glu-tRNA(Gln) amidotransferase subunit GatE [Methanohalobium sp.]
MSEKFDYEKLGLKCGLEIHQQLDTHEKLFCRCPTKLRGTNDSNLEFFRYIRPTASEMGKTDLAALEQSKLNRKYIYKAYDSTCLVEYDEEPPNEIDKEALNTSLTITKLLNMQPVDQMHVMRKIVVDGSNTTGFQRTAFLASGGFLETSNGYVGMDSLCLEEESARIIEQNTDSTKYSLDRLGIPLVEIGTAPDIHSPQQARETAQLIGMLLRSTGKVKRGLGTIRQDVNISIAKGARIEIKGVQSLEQIESIVENEVERQINLIKIRDELLQKGAHVNENMYDVSEVFADTQSKIIKKALKKGKVIAGVLPGFAGFIGKEIQPGRRLGTEFSDRAKTSGVGGIFHTDELPNYGITEDEIESLCEYVDAGDNDAVVLVSDNEKRSFSAIESVIQRAKEALEGVPEETRKALPDGNNSYMRPLPGAARMYPETDVPQVEISREYFESIEMPELLSDKINRFKQEFGLNQELAEKVVQSKDLPLFEDIMRTFKYSSNINATIVARTLTGTVPELRREGVEVDSIKDEHFFQLFELVEDGKTAKEGIEEILKKLADNPELSAENAASELGLTGVDTSEIEKFVDEVIDNREEFVQEKGLDAVGPLMGVVMGEFRGKADGKQVSSILKQKIEEYLSQQ